MGYPGISYFFTGTLHGGVKFNQAGLWYLAAPEGRSELRSS